MARIRAKRVRMTKEQEQLYKEVEKLVKTANKRLNKMMQLTGQKGTFASSQLYDYLDSSNLKAINRKGIIELKKNYKLMQLQAIKTSVEKFLSSKTSTIQGIKQQKLKFQQLSGKELDFKQTDTIYKTGKDYTWIYEYMTSSEFWGTWEKVAKREKWDVETFSEQIALRIKREIDEELKQQLESLYMYIMG